MRIYRGDTAILVESSKYPKGRLSVVPFKVGRQRARVGFSFSTNKAMAEKFARGTPKKRGGATKPVLITAEVLKVRRTENWDWEREVVPVGTFEVTSIKELR